MDITLLTRGIKKLKLSFFPFDFPLKSNYKSAAGGQELITNKQSVFIKLMKDSGEFGVGEASYVTVKNRVSHNIHNDLKLLEQITKIKQLEGILEGSDNALNPRIRHAISVAFLDLISKTQEQPLWQIINDMLEQPCSNLIIPKIVVFEDDLEKFDSLITSYKSAKIKISAITFDSVIDVLKQSKSRVHFALDANGSLTNDLSLISKLEVLTLSGEIFLEYLEQPIKPRMENRLKLMNDLIKSFRGINFAIDQDIRFRDDFFDWLELREVIWVCKVSVLGSILEFLEIFNLAKQRNIRIALGGMFETVIGKTVLSHLFKALNPEFPAEISPPDRYFYESWILTDVSHLNPINGIIYLPKGIGLGIEYTDDFLKLFKKFQTLT